MDILPLKSGGFFNKNRFFGESSSAQSSGMNKYPQMEIFIPANQLVCERS